MPAVEYEKRLPGWKRSGCCDSLLAGLSQREMGFALHHLPEPARVRHHVPQGDGAGRLGGLAVLLDHQAGEFRQMLRQRFIKAQLALIRQDGDAHGRDRLAHRGDPEDVVRPHLPILGDVRLANCAEVDDPILGGDERHDAGNFAFIDKLLHPRRDGGEAIRPLCSQQSGCGDEAPQGRQRRNGPQCLVEFHVQTLSLPKS